MACSFFNLHEMSVAFFSCNRRDFKILHSLLLSRLSKIIKEMIQEWFASITPKHWSDCIDHVKEKVYWASDIARDEMLEPVVITLTEGDEETDTADEFEDDMSNYTSTCIVQK